MVSKEHRNGLRLRHRYQPEGHSPSAVRRLRLEWKLQADPNSGSYLSIVDRQAPIKPDIFISATHGYDNHQDELHHYWHACNERENSLEEPAFEDENTQFNANTSILQREQVPYSQCNFGVLSTALEFINRLPPTTHNCMTGFDTPVHNLVENQDEDNETRKSRPRNFDPDASPGIGILFRDPASARHERVSPSQRR